MGRGEVWPGSETTVISAGHGSAAPGDLGGEAGPPLSWMKRAAMW